MPHDNKALSYTQIEYSVADETAQEERRGGALTEFGKLEHFNLLDTVLRQDGGRSADRAQVEATVLLTRRRHLPHDTHTERQRQLPHDRHSINVSCHTTDRTHTVAGRESSG